MITLKNKTQGNFTMISNTIFRDKKLSMKDRGVLCTLLSLPDCWEFSIDGLRRIVADGYESISNSIKNLERLGYLRRNRYRSKDGKYRTEIEVFYEKPGRKETVSDPVDTSEDPADHPGFPVTAEPGRLTRDGSPVADNQGQYNTDDTKLKYKTDKEKSIIHSDTETTQISNSVNEGTNDDSFDRLLSSTRRRVEYDRLTGMLKGEEIQYADLLVKIITKYLCPSSDRNIKVAGVYIEGHAATARLLNYSYDEIYGVAKNLQSLNVGFNKPDSYYLTALDNQLQLNKPSVYAELRLAEKCDPEDDT